MLVNDKKLTERNHEKLHYDSHIPAECRTYIRERSGRAVLPISLLQPMRCLRDFPREGNKASTRI